MEIERIISSDEADFATLYSLEKLIEWKSMKEKDGFIGVKTLYSLEKLIEWKFGVRLG